MGEVFICKKYEAYSYDELALLGEALASFGGGAGDKACAEALKNLNDKIEALKAALLNNKEGSAVFFMPKTSFDIFFILQAQKPLCNIEKEDMELLHSALNSCDLDEKLKVHLNGKIESLKKFLENGNQVNPVPITVDSMEKMS